MCFMGIEIIRKAVSRATLGEMARQQFGDMVKAVVDVEQGIMALLAANSILTKKRFS